ncbi:MAG TPA: tetratricopeptide repeat protein [Anaeromyxobacter sp.]
MAEAPRDGATTVSLFSRKPRTKTEIVAAADRARARGRVKKAIAGYRKALESDPTDPSVNVKLAPLLAREGDSAGGASCFRVAASRHLAQGFTDRAAAVNLAATAVFPLDDGFRLELARLNVARGRKLDAVNTLLEGGRAQARARRPDVAAALLGRALEIEPWHLETCLALVPILARSGHPVEARQFVDGLLTVYRGPARRRIRWVAFRTWPGVRTLWRWLTASG